MSYIDMWWEIAQRNQVINRNCKNTIKIKWVLVSNSLAFNNLIVLCLAAIGPLKKLRKAMKINKSDKSDENRNNVT